MAKWVNPSVIDAMLLNIAEATWMVALDGQPASYQDAWDNRLAVSKMAPEDFKLLDGEVSGRRLQINDKTNVGVVKPGYADHIALLGPGERLAYVTTCPRSALYDGEANIARWHVEIGSPV